MATNAKPVYKRILLKLSGEALQGTEGFGIDASILDRMAQEIKELVELGIQVGVVIGGGNLFRGAGLAKAGMNRVVGDHMGMLATVMNCIYVSEIFRSEGMMTQILTPFECWWMKRLSELRWNGNPCRGKKRLTPVF